MKYLAGIALLASLGIGSVQASHLIHRQLHPASRPAEAQYLVLLVLDGGRPGYLNLPHLPHIAALQRGGTRFTQAIDGILESETPSGHTTLSTGSTPRRNGILGFDWAQNDNDYSLFSPDVVRSGAMERIMSSAHVPTLAGMYKARHPKARVVALSGHKYYAADPLGGPSADAIMYYQGDAKGRYVPVAIPGHTPPAKVLNDPQLVIKSIHLATGQDNGAATNLALAAFNAMQPHMLLINYPEFDWPLGHVNGGSEDRPMTMALMQKLDGDIGRIEDAYRRRGILNQTLFIITADHGMGTINRFIPSSVVTNAAAKAKVATASTSYNGAAYVWLKQRSKARDVAYNIAAARDPGVESVYYLATTGRTQSYLEAGRAVGQADNAANRYLLTTLMNGHQPDVVAFSRVHATFSPSSAHWKGDHGGAQYSSQHIPLLLSGPGIRRGVTIKQPAQLDDVAPTALQDMGVRPTNMEGHALTDALISPSGTETKARTLEIRAVTPIVQALIAQRKYETHTR